MVPIYSKCWLKKTSAETSLVIFNWIFDDKIGTSFSSSLYAIWLGDLTIKIIEKKQYQLSNLIQDK